MRRHPAEGGSRGVSCRSWWMSEPRERYCPHGEGRLIMCRPTKADLEGLRRVRGLIPEDMDLAELSRLTELTFPRAFFRDESLAHIARLTNLKELDIGIKTLTDGGVSHLRGMTDLRVLNLGSSGISDVALDDRREAASSRGLGRKPNPCRRRRVSPPCLLHGPRTTKSRGDLSYRRWTGSPGGMREPERAQSRPDLRNRRRNGPRSRSLPARGARPCRHGGSNRPAPH